MKKITDPLTFIWETEHAENYVFVQVPASSQYFEVHRYEHTNLGVCCRDIRHSPLADIIVPVVKFRNTKVYGKASYMKDYHLHDMGFVARTAFKKWVKQHTNLPLTELLILTTRS